MAAAALTVLRCPRHTHKHHYFESADKLKLLKELTQPMRNELRIELYKPHLIKLPIFDPECLHHSNSSLDPRQSHRPEDDPRSADTKWLNPPAEFFVALAATMGASPGTQTQDTTLVVLYELVS